MNRVIAIAISLLTLALLASCGDDSSSSPLQSDIDATVEARVTKALAEAVTPSPAPPSTSVSMTVPTASPAPTSTPIPPQSPARPPALPTLAPIPTVVIALPPSPTPGVIPTPVPPPPDPPLVQGLGVNFLEIKEAFALAGYTPINCTFPENYDKYECQGEDTLALYRAPNEYVEVLFTGLMNDLRAVAVAMNLDAIASDNAIINEFVAAEILIAEYVVPLWNLEDRISFSNSKFQTLATDPTAEITENVGHVSIKTAINTRNWMVVLFERDSETEVRHVRKEPSLQVGWTDIKNSYALEGFTSEICLTSLNTHSLFVT